MTGVDSESIVLDSKKKIIFALKNLMPTEINY